MWDGLNEVCRNLSVQFNKRGPIPSQKCEMHFMMWHVPHLTHCVYLRQRSTNTTIAITQCTSMQYQQDSLNVTCLALSLCILSLFFIRGLYPSCVSPMSMDPKNGHIFLWIFQLRVGISRSIPEIQNPGPRIHPNPQNMTHQRFLPFSISCISSQPSNQLATAGNRQ